jgi:hypothetical protein
MLATGILTALMVRSDDDKRAGFRRADLADAFEPLAVLVFDIPHYNNRSMSPTAHAVRLGDFPCEALPQSLKKHHVTVFLNFFLLDDLIVQKSQIDFKVLHHSSPCLHPGLVYLGPRKLWRRLSRVSTLYLYLCLWLSLGRTSRCCHCPCHWCHWSFLSLPNSHPSISHDKCLWLSLPWLISRHKTIITLYHLHPPSCVPYLLDTYYFRLPFLPRTFTIHPLTPRFNHVSTAKAHP